jgi:predicted nucleotidyltransferase
MVHPFIKDKLPELTEIFKRHQVKKAYVFGSAVTDRFNESSDVDFLIEPLEPGDEPDPVVRGEILWDLYYALQDLFGRKVDMVTRDSLTNKYFIEELNRTSVPIYG